MGVVSVRAHRVIALATVMLVGLVAVQARHGSRGPTSSLELLRLPQRAVGDFDGDGRLDVAQIQHDSRGPSIIVQLSDSAFPAHLDANVTAVVERDIDHDGDLDLIATTPTGDVLVWINDGHGEFTRHDVSHLPHVSGVALVRAGPAVSAAVLVQRIALSRVPPRRHRLIVTTRIRPPTVCGSCSSLPYGLLPLFRAPPTLHS